MKDGIDSAETGVGYWQPWWSPDGTIREIIDPGRLNLDGTPVVVGDPMYGVWSAATYTPQWFIDTYQGHSLVDVILDRAGYDGSRFSDTNTQHESVDSVIRDLFENRGFDQASLWAFLQAASMADVWQDMNGHTGSSMHDTTAMLGAVARHQREWNDLPWWDKYEHEILVDCKY